jgi:hypothetical protein
LPTAKLGLELIDDGDLFSVVQTKLNGNAQDIDDFFGAVECTSGTRPSSPFPGLLIRETDTGYLRLRNGANTTWVLLGQSLGVVANADALNPFINQMIWNRTDRLWYVWTGSAWVREAPAILAAPTQLASGTLAVGGNGVVVYQLTVTDPGFPYWLEMAGAIGWGMVSATQPGNLIEASITIDSTVYNTNRNHNAYQISHSLGAGFTQPSCTVSPKNSAAFGSFTGTHVARLIARNSGGASMTIPAAMADGYFNVRVIPAT